MEKKVWIVAILLLLNFSVANAASKIPLPDDINIVVDSSLPKEIQDLLGKWEGRFEPPGIDIILIVEKIDLGNKKAQVVYANAEFFGYAGRNRYDVKANWQRGESFIIFDSESGVIRLELNLKLINHEIAFDYNPKRPGILDGRRFRRGETSYITMKRSP